MCLYTRKLFLLLAICIFPQGFKSTSFTMFFRINPSFQILGVLPVRGYIRGGCYDYHRLEHGLISVSNLYLIGSKATQSPVGVGKKAIRPISDAFK